MSRGSMVKSESESGIGEIMTFPFRFLWGFVVFLVFAWTTSRNARAFFLSFPAVIAVILITAAVWIVQFRGEQRSIGLTSALYARAMDPEKPQYKPAAAVLMGKKLNDLLPEEKQTKYQLALAYYTDDNHDRAMEIMEYLAPRSDLLSNEAGKGFPPAHLWQAAYYSSPKLTPEMTEEERLEIGRHHVELAYKADPANVDAVIGMAAYTRDEADQLLDEVEELEEQGETEQAAELKAKADAVIDRAMQYLNEGIGLDLRSAKQLYATPQLIELLQKQGNDSDARSIGLRFINRYEDNALSTPDQMPFWISIIRTCILIGDYDRAMKFVLKGYQLAQDPVARNALRQLAAEVNVERSKSLEDMDDKKQFTDRLYALCEAVVSDFQSGLPYRELLYYVDGFDSDSEQEDWLRDSILGAGSVDSDIDTMSPTAVAGAIHVVLGLHDIVQANKKGGMRHWDIAAKQFPFAPVAINVLIQIFDEERKLSRAKRLHLIKAAIEQFPQTPFFYATRGRMLMEEEEYEKAAEDYEFANSRISNNLLIVENLVKCYREIGNEEKLAKYEKELKKLEAEKAAREEEADVLGTFYSG